jgi:hypothetical protein
MEAGGQGLTWAVEPKEKKKYVGADIALTWRNDAKCIVAFLPLDVSHILKEHTWAYVRNAKFQLPLHFLFLAATVIF